MKWPSRDEKGSGRPAKKSLAGRPELQLVAMVLGAQVKAGSHTTKAKSRSLVIRPRKGMRANFLGMTTFAFAAEEMETLSGSQTRVGTRTSDGSDARTPRRTCPIFY
jgi:hypothetical protein